MLRIWRGKPAAPWHDSSQTDLGYRTNRATELLVCAERLGLRVMDLPVTWTDDRNSKARIGKLTVEYLLAIYTPATATTLMMSR